MSQSFSTLAIQQQQVDLSNCDKEPIQSPGAIQTHGALVVLDEHSLQVEFISENALEMLGLPCPTAEACVGKAAEDLLHKEVMKCLEVAKQNNRLDASLNYLLCQWVCAKGTNRGQRFNVVFHNHSGYLYLEFEPDQDDSITLSEMSYLLKEPFDTIERTNTLADVYEQIVEHVKNVAGYDRVMLYRFSPEGHGQVVAERAEQSLEPYLSLHYPASDIPKQARKLYLSNRIRIIPDINYIPIGVAPLCSATTEKPLDLSYTILRSVSPIHIEYLQNMGVEASMVISVVVNGELWGLIACHHYSPKPISFPLRMVCDLIGRHASMHLDSLLKQEAERTLAKIKGMQTDFVNLLNHYNNPVDAFMNYHPSMANYIQSDGCGIFHKDEYQTNGLAPSKEEFFPLIDWLGTQLSSEMDNDPIALNDLTHQYPASQHWQTPLAGLLAIRVPNHGASWLVWFRQEQVQFTHWAGDPNKPVTIQTHGERLTPRGSFELWKEEVAGYSLRWQKEELQAAKEIADVLVRYEVARVQDIKHRNEALERMVAERTRELSHLNDELKSFSYSVSHDLRAPLRSIHGYCEAFTEDFGQSLTGEAQHYLNRIQTNVIKMSELMNGLLKLSRLNNKAVQPIWVDVSAMVQQIAQRIQEEDYPGHDVDLLVAEGITCYADPELLEVLLCNLLSNAWKFTQMEAQPAIQVTQMTRDGKSWLAITDNGVGFNPEYANKLFMAFQRLHTEFEGHGIGLATAKRILHQHNGLIEATGVEGQGATFYLYFPPPASDELDASIESP